MNVNMVRRHTSSQETKSVEGDTGAVMVSPSLAGEVAAHPVPCKPGDCIGRYTVGELLGAGGMGQVHSAVDPELGRTVALKLILPARAASSPRASARFVREAQALARLHHPNVVTIYEVGTSAGRLFIAMELVAGVTLGHWLAAEPRDWRAVRDVFVAAGRGLAAAHAAGIVHRDFKPHNVIVGAERVVVVDFGLARLDGVDVDDSYSDSTSPMALSVSLTQTNERVGTPMYMAPEQRAGGVVSAQADQYAFCVALRAALEGAQAPRFLLDAVERGLAVRPADRWPSMPALLEAIGRPFWTRRRQRVAAAVGLAALTGVAGVAFLMGRGLEAKDPCAGGAALAAPIWDDDARTRVAEAFRKTGRPYADTTFALVDTALRGRLDGWAAAHRDACEATQVRHEQSADLLDRRMECLAQARREAGELVKVLEHADATAVDKAARVTAGVADVTPCADLLALRTAVPPPRDPEAARQAERLRADVAKVNALHDLGAVKDGVAAGRRLVDEARTLGYAPILAAALLTTGRLESENMNSDGALELLYEGTRVSGEAHDDALAAQTFSHIEHVLGNDKKRFEAADMAYVAALAAAATAGRPPAVLYHLVAGHAVSLHARSAYAAELPLNLLTIALAARQHGANSIQTANALADLALTMADLGDDAGALGVYPRALRIATDAAGTDHPITLAIMNNMGKAFLEVHDDGAAGDMFARALAGKERVYGADNPVVASTAHNLGMIRADQRRLPEARALIERSLRLRLAKPGAVNPQVPTDYEELANIARLEGHPAEGLGYLEKALAIYLAEDSDLGPEVANVYRAQASLCLVVGRVGEARAAIEKAAAIDEKTLPAGHARRAETLEIRADVFRAAGQARAAVTLYEKALAGYEESEGKDASSLIECLMGLSQVLVESGDGPRAVASAERAVSIATARKVPADIVGAAQFRLAQARWSGGHDRAAALALARTTRARLAGLPYRAEVLGELEGWLAKHGRS